MSGTITARVLFLVNNGRAAATGRSHIVVAHRVRRENVGEEEEAQNGAHEEADDGEHEADSAPRRDARALFCTCGTGTQLGTL